VVSEARLQAPSFSYGAVDASILSKNQPPCQQFFAVKLSSLWPDSNQRVRQRGELFVVIREVFYCAGVPERFKPRPQFTQQVQMMRAESVSFFHVTYGSKTVAKKSSEKLRDLTSVPKFDTLFTWQQYSAVLTAGGVATAHATQHVSQSVRVSVAGAITVLLCAGI
jgi:hypothetical protein